MYNMKNASRNTEYKQVATPETLYYNTVYLINRGKDIHRQKCRQTTWGKLGEKGDENKSSL